uniref:Cuticular protein n=1 Tax=Daphnia magna TaxID=35525 RepID=A0A0P4Z7Y2_9CRUS
MNPIVLFLACTLAFSVASPTDYASSKSTTSSDTEPAVSILKQINQMNDDGSYTFGFEASDGSFRIENMDANGYMTGKYGYIDANGKLQETEYAAGKMSGQSVGFQTRGTLLSDAVRNSQALPIIRTSTKSVEQKAIDYEYTSVDDDEDGFPDSSPARDINYNAGVVRISSPAKETYDIQPTVVRVANPHTSPLLDVSVVAPARKNKEAGTVRFVSSAKNSYENPSTAIRVADPYDAAVSDIRVLTPTKTVSQVAIPNVRVPVRSSSRRTNNVVRLIDQNDDAYVKKNNVRVTAPTRISYDQAPAAIRAVNRETATYDSFPIVKQTVEPSKTIKEVAQVAVPVVRLASSGYGKSSGRSTSRLDEFLRSLKTNNRNSDNEYNAYQSGSSDLIIQNDFESQEVFQSVQDFQPIQDDAISVDSFGFTRII